MSLKTEIRRLLVDKKQFKSQFELSQQFGIPTYHVRSTIHMLRKEGLKIAKLARKDPVTGRMLPAHYYVPFHSRDLNISTVVPRGRPRRVDAYATNKLPVGA